MASFTCMIVLFMAFISSVVGTFDVLLGTYYGLAGNNLPPPWQVVQLCREHNIRRIRLDEPNLDVFDAFRGAGIELSFSVPNDMLTDMATNKSLVEEWFNTYVEPFIGEFDINYIIVGDKAMVPGLAECILPIMKSLQNLLSSHYLGVKLTTLVGYKSTLVVKNPPSSGEFDPNIVENMRGILKFLSNEGSPLMVSVYPYEACLYSSNISVSYATFSEQNTVVRDGKLNYTNLFDEMVDAFYAAIDKEDVGDVVVAVGETGWPTCGYYNIATPWNAAAYNENLKNHISSGKGTPNKPDVYTEGFIRSIFNENEEPEGESQCFGIFNVDSTPIYPLF